jgi:acyl carrier protein
VRRVLSPLSAKVSPVVTSGAGESSRAEGPHAGRILAPRTRHMEATEEQLRSLIVERFEIDPERLRPDTNLVNDLGATSLDVVDLVMTIEERLGVKIDDAEAESIRTFRDAVAVVQAKREARAH